MMRAPNLRRAPLKKPRRKIPARPVDLENFLPFLVNRASGRITASFSAAIADRGLSLADARTLTALWSAGEMRLVELSTATDIDLSTLSRLIRRLARRGLCRIAKRARDGRAGGIALTASGRALIAAMAPLGPRHERTLTEGFSRDEIALFKELLRKLYRNALKSW